MIEEIEKRRGNAENRKNQNQSTKCPFNECDGSGFIVPEPDSGERIKKCRCRIERERKERARKRNKSLQELFDRAAIPKKFRDRGFEEYDPERQPGIEKAYRAAKKYCQNWPVQLESGKGLYFQGPHGIGKTHLAYSITQRLIEEEQAECYTIPAVRLIRKLKPGYEDTEQREQKLINIDLLLIDDLARARKTDWVAETLSMIIEERYLECRPTIFTSLFEVEQLGGFDENSPDWGSIEERITEMCIEINMDGISQR